MFLQPNRVITNALKHIVKLCALHGHLGISVDCFLSFQYDHFVRDLLEGNVWLSMRYLFALHYSAGGKGLEPY